MTEAVIFDLYNTLIYLDRDTSPYQRFARLVRPHDPSSVLRRSLVMDAQDIASFARRLGVEPPAETAGLDADLQRDLLSARLYDDVSEALAVLRGLGLKLGLISNLATPYKEPFRRLGLATHFDAVLFSCDTGRRKSESMVYLQVALELGVSLTSILMVGDNRRSDYDGPRAVGMDAVLLQRSGLATDARSIAGLRELPAALSR